jgi:uncharacterized protein (TIGR00369 family)
MNLKLAIFKPMLKLAMERTGHGAALGFELTRIGRGEVEMSFPYKEEVVGNPVTGVVHGGVIVSLLDTCCGCAAISVLKRPSVTPTMDLRLDYMHPAEPGQPIYVSAKVYRDTFQCHFLPRLGLAGGSGKPHCPLCGHLYESGYPEYFTG